MTLPFQKATDEKKTFIIYQAEKKHPKYFFAWFRLSTEKMGTPTPTRADVEQALSKLPSIEEDKDGGESLSSSHTDDEAVSDDFSDLEESGGIMDRSQVYKAVRKSRIIAGVVLLVATLASILFLYNGMHGLNEKADTFFQTRAEDIIAAIELSFRDYDNAALLAHDRCRRERNTTRQEFHEFYKYLLAAGMEFLSVQCAPNVTLAQRPLYEGESLAFYTEHYPEANYTGFNGFVPDEENGGFKVVPSLQLPVYFPVYYAEPVMPNAKALGLDMYSHPPQKREIDLAVTTHRIVLSKRLRLVQEFDDGAYSVILYHPGIPLATSPDVVPLDLADIVVRIPSLLARAAMLEHQSLAVYVYDTTVINTGGHPEFLGAMAYKVGKNDDTKSYEQIPEVEMDTLVESKQNDRLYQVEIPIASGTWKIYVTPLDDTYNPNYAFVIFGGIMVFLSGVFAAIFLSMNANKLKQIHMAKIQAEAERDIVASLFPDNVRERLMKDVKARKAARVDKSKFRTNKDNMKGGMDPHSGVNSISNQLGLPSALTSEGLFGSKPIADFHAHVTIMSLDLKGFTAWSSVREPSQVFTLLEVIYYSFDAIAKRRRIFKVETQGDTYVAAAGVPTDRKDHAVVMARFAVDCLVKFHVVARELETILGPDTGELDVRIGIHR